MFFFEAAHAGFGDHEREFFDTKIATDVVDEVNQVTFVGRVVFVVDAIVPTLMPIGVCLRAVIFRKVMAIIVISLEASTRTQHLL